MNNQPVKDHEFTFLLQGESRWILASSGSQPNSRGTVHNYIFMRDITRYRKRENLFSYLNQAATALAKTRDTKTALSQIAQFIVPSFANWFTVDVLKDGALDLILLKHEDPEKIKWAYEYRKNYPADLNADAGAALVLKTGKPGFVPVVTEQLVDLSIS